MFSTCGEIIYKIIFISSSTKQHKLDTNGPSVIIEHINGYNPLLLFNLFFTLALLPVPSASRQDSHWSVHDCQYMTLPVTILLLIHNFLY